MPCNLKASFRVELQLYKHLKLCDLVTSCLASLNLQQLPAASGERLGLGRGASDQSLRKIDIVGS